MGAERNPGVFLGWALALTGVMEVEEYALKSGF
jgi:hypothetical protein